MKILGLETSCDETGVAIYDSEHGLLSDVVFSQVKMHAKYGGVVPELASRDHIRKIGLLVNQAVEEASIRLQDLDGVAYTAGPGLAGALLVGAGFSKSLAWGLDVPALGIHHMEGHLLAPMIDEVVPIDMPFLALLVSGGHTLLVDACSLGSYEVLGESLDDAVGEAFDKVAKMLDLGYPGGPLVEQLAKSGDPDRFDFPRPMTNRPGLDFSFSGLKTHVRNTIAQHHIDAALKADVCRGFTDAVVDVLVVKCRRAIRQSGAKKLVVAGGVSANKDIRNGLEMLGKEEDVRVVFPSMKFTTDNGAMIAYAGYKRMSLGERDKTELAVRARWPLNELSRP
jgi:N6-L-threonylcarbamoyladenine synthase|tara:strand:- start:1261 stop:2277 length:1017 start_codon:yes stop_codon:yes gene_type:complete